MTSANSRLAKLVRAVVAFVRRGEGRVESRREPSRFEERQLLALLALRRCFGNDNRWMVTIPAHSAKLQRELERSDWRELARMLAERL